jgi:ABC-type multidrug transport system fused ATPase/permease subunit
VQFSSAIFYGEEDTGKVVISLMRLGYMKGRASALYTTVDGSGKAGERYVHKQGEVVFEDGVAEQTIEIELIEDDTWAPTLEFKVLLQDARGCTLGKYLYICRIKVIDSDFFPSNEFEDLIMKGRHGIEEIPKKRLIIAFIYFCYSIPGVARTSMKVFVLCQLHNLYYLLTIFLNMYLIDLLDGNWPEEHLWCSSRERTAVVMALLYAVPLIFLHVADLWKVRLDLAAEIRFYFQRSIVRKYLNYDQAARSDNAPASVSAAVIQECGEAVENGYMVLFEIFQGFGSILIVAYFLVLENATAIVPLLLFPVALGLWLGLRTAMYIEIIEKVRKAEEHVGGLVHEMCGQYQLIADYFQRPQMNEHFSHVAEHMNEAMLPVEYMEVNSSYVPKWLSTLLYSSYLCFSSGEVLSGGLSLGRFIATLKVFKEVGEIFEEGYKNFVKLTSATGPLLKLTTMLNSATDLRDLKIASDKRIEVTKDLRKALIAKRTDGVMFVTDLLPLQINNLTFKYPKRSEVDFAPVIENATIPKIKQGSMIVLVGPHQGGKTTLLKLIAQHHHPTSGSVFIPTHLRVLQVMQDPTIMDLTLVQNLCFGSPDEHRQRIVRIMRRMGLEDLEKHLDDPRDVWMPKLTYTDQAAIHLARAFVMNPEVLVMHRPTIHFDSIRAGNVYSLLHEFVECRGIELPAVERDRRRPRTCFMTTSSLEEAKRADIRIEVGEMGKGVVREVSVDDLLKKTEQEGLS